MIASWMIYAVVVGLMVTAAALVAERVLLLLRRPVRGLWAVALSASLLVPCLSHFFPRLLPIPTLVESTVRRAKPAEVVRMVGEGTAVLTKAAGGFPLDRVLLIGWVVAALGLGQLMLYSMAVLHGRRREWRRQTVNGVAALIAPDFGPAVVGWRAFEIVLPEWTLDLAEDARALVVHHESEHVDRRDPRLLLHAFFVVLAMPWNPAIWWQFRRLRRAIELDCDARVIGSGVDVARYGEVLIEAGGFCRSGGLPALATFAERSSDLEARIKALAPIAPNARLVRVTVGGFAALVLAVAACLVPDPLSPDLPQKIAQAAQTQDISPEIVAWVRTHLSGSEPAAVVILIRSSTGTLLGKEYMSPTPGSLRSQRVGGGPGILDGIPGSSIHSVEVVNNASLGVPGITGVIVVTLIPGVQLKPLGTGVSYNGNYPMTLKQMVTLSRGRVQFVFGRRLPLVPGSRYQSGSVLPR